jgi:peptidoglycan/xylan/chitin deacetylase (PgdA/CDA1 family)
MLALRLRAAVAATLLVAGSPAPRPDAPTRRVAITFDDLPVVSRHFTTIEDHERITRRLVAAIRAHHVAAIGFVNEGKLYRGGVLDDRAVGLLRQWTKAGLELGNHTSSHLDLHTVPLGDYLADLTRGDSVTRRVLREAGRTPRYFRHPYLHTGRSLETRAAVDSVLASRGYRVAPVTVDNGDYLFAAAYDAALGRRDSTEARRIGREYVAYMERAFAFYESQSVTIVGREIPQVLLVHASVMNADWFDALARMLERRGYAFVSLDQALSDSAYRSRDTYTGPAGISWLHRWALTRGLRGSVFAGEPEVPAAIAAAAADTSR